MAQDDMAALEQRVAESIERIAADVRDGASAVDDRLRKVETWIAVAQDREGRSGPVQFVTVATYAEHRHDLKLWQAGVDEAMRKVGHRIAYWSGGLAALILAMTVLAKFVG